MIARSLVRHELAEQFVLIWDVLKWWERMHEVGDSEIAFQFPNSETTSCLALPDPIVPSSHSTMLVDAQQPVLYELPQKTELNMHCGQRRGNASCEQGAPITQKQ
jgi:hypothetical protein